MAQEATGPLVKGAPAGLSGDSDRPASDLTVLDPTTRPNAMSMAAGDVLRSTIDHAVWFHRWTRADEWWLCDVDSPWAGDGRGFARGRLFDRSGVLVAEIAQEGLIRLPADAST